MFDATPSTPVPTRVPEGLPYVALSADDVLAVSCAYVCANPALNSQVGGSEAACTGYCESLDYATSCATFESATGYCAGWMDFDKGTGTSSKFNLGTNMADNASTMCVDNNGNSVPGDNVCNPNVDFKLVWDAIDSPETGLGFGDIDYPADGWDEDGDGSEFDRIFGVPYIDVTKLNALGATIGPLCDISKGMAEYVNPLSDHYQDEDYNVNYPLAGDIVGTLGDAGCDDDDPYTPCCSELFSTYSGQYDCGVSVVDAFITGSCNDAISDGIIAACSDETSGAGTPSLFATGFCMGQIEDNLAGCATVGWQTIVGGVCNGLGVDCSSDLGAAQAMFDAVCTGAALQNGIPAGQVTTCAGLAAATGQDQNALECGFLEADFWIDSDNDGTNDLPFYVGACSTVAGGVVGAIDTDGDGTTDTCSEWVATFTQDAIDSFAQPSLGGATCTYYGDVFVDECLETATGDYNLDAGTEMYLFKPGAGLDQWGDFMTYNGAVFASLAGQAGTMNDQNTGLSLIPCNGSYDSFPLTSLTGDATTDAAAIGAFTAGCNPHLWVNDSNHDFNSACMADCLPDGSNPECTLDCSGRLRMTFEPTCVPEIEARQIVAEFVDLTSLCNHSGDVDYSCAAYDWNYNFLADVDEDGISEADCSAFAAATGQSYVVNSGPITPSCDDDITTNCTDYSSTVVWNAAYNMCGDGDPNDLIDLGADGFCALAMGVETPAFPSTEYCLGYYDQQGGIPSFEQSCTVGDGSVSVTDVVRIINHIIGNDATFGNSVDQLGGEAACEADFNNDGNINVVDVVAIVNQILANNGGRVADASEASILTENNKIVVDADGYIGAVDMIVEFSDNAIFEIADGFASTSRVNGNRAHIILIGDKDGISDVLTMTSGKIVAIEEVLVASSSDFVTTSINQPSIFSVGAAYPNPFNPSTNISLVLNANADLSVKVYNLTGQLVDVIAEGNFSPSSYNWTWKAENLASGVYFIKAQVGSEVSTQKVMLLK